MILFPPFRSERNDRGGFKVRNIHSVGLLVYPLLLLGCSSQQASNSSDPSPSTQNANAPASPGASPAQPAIPDKARTMALSAQGVAPIGLTVRVKGIELGTDATILTVSASYGGTDTNNVPLASDPTYLQDEQGNKLMLKQPSENPWMHIIRGQQMDGQLVFLGAVAPGTKTLTLVINNNNPGDSVTAPGLSIPLHLDGAAN
ncbi:MAG: hypothetical protein QM605_05045 [Sphingobium sp.]